MVATRDIGDGKVEIKLNKTVVDEKTLTFTCTLNVNAVERTELGSNEVLPSNTYIIEGNYVDESGNAIANANLVIFSETPHYVTTDNNGYVFCNGLEKGSHEIYYVEDTLDNIKSMTKGEIISNAVSKTSFTTLSEGELIFDDNSKIASNRIVTKDVYCNNLVGKVWEYNYIKKEDSLKIVCDGIYKLETWGAQGGNVSVYGVSTTGGYGGYSYGNAKLVENQFLYINVGGAGSTSSGGVGVTKQGGYNGGGANTQSEWGYGGTGGGATHIALRSGLLSELEDYKEDVLIVSGGGGSGGVEVTGERYTIGGNAGGYAGVNAKPVNCDGNGCATYGGSGGNQSKGYKFGLGSNGSSWGGAGGGGLYGGTYASGGGGGSSYIANPLLTDKAMYCYGCSKSTNVDTYTVSVSCKNSTPTKNCAKTGSGYAKITLVSVE